MGWKRFFGGEERGRARSECVLSDFPALDLKVFKKRKQEPDSFIREANSGTQRVTFLPAPPNSHFGRRKGGDGLLLGSRISDVSISATGVVEGKTAWFGIDFGRETNRTIEKVVIYTPANLTLLGTMENFKVILYDNDKNVLAEKTFSTTPSEKSTNITSWELDAPVKARALRVESSNPSQPLALTEVEAYGPEDAEDTPVPASAEK